MKLSLFYKVGASVDVYMCIAPVSAVYCRSLRAAVPPLSPHRDLAYRARS